MLLAGQGVLLGVGQSSFRCGGGFVSGWGVLSLVGRLPTGRSFSGGRLLGDGARSVG